MTFFPKDKPTFWQRIKWFFFGKPKYKIQEFKSITMPVIKADFPTVNKNTFTQNCLKHPVIVEFFVKHHKNKNE